MIANSATPYPQEGPHPFTLNDLRVRNTVADAPSSTSGLTLAAMGLAVALAVGAFAWVDPLHWFTPKEASPPTPAFVPSAEPAQPTQSQDLSAPLAHVTATKSAEAPIVPAPAVETPQVAAPMVQPRSVAIKPDSHRNPAARTDTRTKVALASPTETTAPLALTKPEERATPPVLLSKPEEKTDAPIVPKVADDTQNAPKPAATNDQMPAAE